MAADNLLKYLQILTEYVYMTSKKLLRPHLLDANQERHSINSCLTSPVRRGNVDVSILYPASTLTDRAN
jgi:hypothetical protein